MDSKEIAMVSNDPDVDVGKVTATNEIVIDDGVRRALKSRHLQMIALGGIIGPGSFYATGFALQYAGPAGALIGYIVIGLDVYLVTFLLAEMATLFPSTGAFNEFAGRFMDPALSFSLGWNYWYMWGTILANEYNGAALILSFWTDKIPNYGWILMCWVFFMGTSLLGVLVYGEMEFWLASFKFAAALILYLVAILIDTGAIGGEYIGFHYWKDPGAFANGINGFGKVLVLAAVMYSGTEAVAITGGESRNPKKDIPRAMKQTFWRILIVYVGMVFFTGLIVPWNSEALLNASSKSASSPFTVALNTAGWSGAGHLINAIIIFTLLSSINSAIYIGSRCIFAQAKVGRAPAFLAKTTSNGTPLNAVVFTNLFGLISLLNISENAGNVFSYLLSISGSAAFIAWAFIGLTHVRFRAAMKAQDMPLSSLPFRSFGGSWVSWILFGANIFLVIISGYTTLLTPFDLKGFIFSYLVIPIFIVLYLGWKFYHKTKWVNPSEADLTSGRRDWLGGPGEEVGRASLFRRVKNIVVG
ncbi:amino acid permease/ SLC12A domain-containing protein [Dactylonectria estremocensis]|uniref:Amino acid permease/ SLC12A domain-containing protein n=1 Tax=Dactylonectria estremocensis TaxID=1079267 RepID=A0A9P9E0R7_9HYPO|nr:amino acid permease/ SLC12A domain-containing protein [Dactylonectria estremocensis]